MVKQFFSSQIERWIVRALPFIIRRSLNRGLSGIWQRGDWDALKNEGAILALNHHSWWDLYLSWFIRQRLARKASGIMREEQLERFRFFRAIGVISERELKEALRRLEKGELLFIFPEGELRQAGKVEQVQRGVSFLARRASVAIYPVAIRVAMRGGERPEAFIELGSAIEARTEDTLESLKLSLNEMLKGIDETLSISHPEKPPVGFEAWLKGHRSTNQRTSWIERFWS